MDLKSNLTGLLLLVASPSMLILIRRLQDFARKKRILLYPVFVDLTKANDLVDRALLPKAFTCFGVTQRIPSVTRQFHDGMCAALSRKVLGVVHRGTGSPQRVHVCVTPVQHLRGGTIMHFAAGKYIHRHTGRPQK